MGPGSSPGRGEVWVYGPRMRPVVWLTWRARSRPGAGEHRQGRRLLIRCVQGSQGVGHGACGLGDDGGVSGVGLGVAGRQVRDASHGQAGQVAHGDAHVLGDGDGQGADGGAPGPRPPAPGRAPRAACRGRVGGPRRWAGPCRTGACRPCSGRWPSGRTCPRPVPMNTSISSVRIAVLLRLAGHGASLERLVPHPRYERTRVSVRSPDQR